MERSDVVMFGGFSNIILNSLGTVGRSTWLVSVIIQERRLAVGYSNLA